MVSDKLNVSGFFVEWKAFLLCILTAGIFWLFNALNQDYTADLTYPIKIVYDPDKFIPVAKLPLTVEFNATGYGWNFLRQSLKLRQRFIYIKPAELPKKNYLTSYEMFPAFSEQLNNVKINYFLKDTIYFNFDNLLKKKITVVVDSLGIDFATNHRVVGNIEVNPKNIYSSGPASMVKEISDTFKLKLPFENVSGEFEETIPLDTAGLSYLKFSTTEVTVAFETKLLEKRQRELPIIKQNFPSNYKLVSDTITFVYYIDPDNAISKSENFKIVADFKKRNKNVITPQLILPEYVKNFETPISLQLKKYVR